MVQYFTDCFPFNLWVNSVPMYPDYPPMANGLSSWLICAILVLDWVDCFASDCASIIYTRRPIRPVCVEAVPGVYLWLSGCEGRKQVDGQEDLLQVTTSMNEPTEKGVCLEQDKINISVKPRLTRVIKGKHYQLRRRTLQEVLHLRNVINAHKCRMTLSMSFSEKEAT